MAPEAESKFDAPMFEPEICRRQMEGQASIEESTCDIIGIFGAPHRDSAPGEMCPPCPSLVTPLIQIL